MFCRRLGLALILLTLLVTLAHAGAVRNISATDAARMLRQNQNVWLLDVRTTGEYFQSRIAGARLIPIDQLAGRLGEVPKDRSIIVYCTVGARSAQVAGYLAQQGYPDVYNLSGGISAWQLRGFPVLQGPP